MIWVSQTIEKIAHPIQYSCACDFFFFRFHMLVDFRFASLNRAYELQNSHFHVTVWCFYLIFLSCLNFSTFDVELTVPLHALPPLSPSKSILISVNAIIIQILSLAFPPTSADITSSVSVTVIVSCGYNFQIFMEHLFNSNVITFWEAVMEHRKEVRALYCLCFNSCAIAYSLYGICKSLSSSNLPFQICKDDCNLQYIELLWGLYNL